MCVNLYPFERTAARRGVTEAEVIENIDIGGPTMIRAAAKNFAFSAVVVDPASYDAVLAGAARRRGAAVARHARGPRGRGVRLHRALRHRDRALVRREAGATSRPCSCARYEKVTDLRYGENPHQRAAYYARRARACTCSRWCSQHGGKELSFNNLLDLNAARLLVDEFELPACAIIKHNNPCGRALGEAVRRGLPRARSRATRCRAFGGVICRQPARSTRALAEALAEQFAEVVFAPGFSDEALEVLGAKPNLRVLEDTERRRINVAERRTLKRVIGGLLVQDRDIDLEDRAEMRSSPSASPPRREWGEMLFAWKVCKHVRSNAIVLAQDLATVGIGAGQMSRVDSVRLAIEKAHGRLRWPAPRWPRTRSSRSRTARSWRSTAGITAIIQPGGSVRDHEVVAAADAAGIAMVFTGKRHFRH